MIKKIEIENYKSIDKLSVEIGQFNVFIGENGCGKSNLLEAIAFASSFTSKIKEDSLVLKGVRISDPIFFRNGFDKNNLTKNINIAIFDAENNKILFPFSNSNEPYAQWTCKLAFNDNREIDRLRNSHIVDAISKTILDKIKEEGTVSKYFKVDADGKIEQPKNLFVDLVIKEGREAITNLVEETATETSDVIVKTGLITYSIYGPENYFLRNYNIDSSYAQPLGAKGEGLLKLIKVIKKEKPEEYKEIIEHLHLIDWFSDIAISDDDLAGAEFKLTDKYLEEGIGGFDIKNANEGFFLLLFYITLFVSDYTPSFFAIDNIDTALNPKLCTKLIEILAVLAKKHNKQVLITTHNPSILDGINLNDDEQRLFAVSRNKTGYTRVTRIEKKQPIEGERSLKLSEQFLRGYIGGIPKNF